VINLLHAYVDAYVDGLGKQVKDAQLAVNPSLLQRTSLYQRYKGSAFASSNSWLTLIAT